MEETQPLLFKKETSFNSSSSSSNGEKVRSYGTTALSGDHGIGDTVSTTNIDIDNTTTTTTTTRTPRATDNNAGTDVQTPSLDIVGLSYSVKERPGHWWNGSCFKPPKKKMVLQNLCLSFQSGELTGLVGSSGSGKTSLLDVISGRATGKATGVVSYKHEQCTRELMQDAASYVLQADRLLPTLTARETLTFMAYLKLSGKFKAKDIDRKVDSVLQDMGLNKVADTRIGGAVIRGVSGGERRRISIAIQLLKDPEILLLDEPTTGLDALSARNLVKGMADLAHKGRLVLMSIHQPRSDIFALLDKVTLMTIGQLAFFGRPDELVPYFTDIGYPCPKNENPCDIYVDIVSVDRRTPSRERTTLQRAKKICNEYANSDLQSDVLKNITKGLSYHFEESLTPETVDTPSWIRSFHTLLVRMNVHLYRDRGAFLMRIMQTFLSVPFIAVFLGHIKYNQASIQDRLGVTYLALNIPHFMGITSGISNFPVLQNMMYRECHDGLYSIITFLSAYYVHALPYTIVSVGIYAPALYWISGLNSDFYAFGSFVLVGVLLEHFSEMMAVAMLALFYHPQVAYNTSMLIFTTASLVASGLLRPLDNMPVFFQWSSYIAVTKYATEILVGNEFEGLELSCSNNTDTHQCVEHGEEVLEVYYPDALKNMNQNFAILGGYTFAILIFAWMMFKVRRIPTLY